MGTRVKAAFDVTGWDQVPGDETTDGPRLSSATVTKTFRGDLAGESTAHLLMCEATPGDLSAGAGYIASERFVGSLGGRSGTFVLHHWGRSGGGAPQQTGGHVVPGSGTDALQGLTGTVEITIDDGGAHHLTLDYALD